MSRALRGRFVVSGVLRALDPIHVGGRGGEGDVDLALARDGLGRWYVPGTSLAGPMRAWLEQRFPRAGRNGTAAAPDLVDALVGSRRTDEGAAGLLLVEDAVVKPPEGEALVTEIRDGVGIDRFRGAAKERIKFDRAVLPAGTELPLRLTVEVPSAWPAKLTPPVDIDTRAAFGALLGHLVGALERGEIGIGAARTRGLGTVALMGARCREETSDRAGVLSRLHAIAAGAEPAGAVTAEQLRGLARGLEPAPLPRLAIEVDWHPAGPLMVRAGFDGLAVDNLPLTTAVGDRLALVLPGSSLKGALRSRAEQLVRTVLRRDTDAGADHRDQLAVPIVGDLFGLPANDQDGTNTNDRDPVGRDHEEQPPGDGDDGATLAWAPGRGALAVRDCRSTPFEPARWDELVDAKETAEAQRAADEVGAGRWSIAHHVAIDRWTGGAGDQLLFTTLEPDEAGWEKLRLEVDLGRLPAVGPARAAALALLMLVLDELGAGRIPVGFATHRGMGSVEVRNVSLRCDDWAVIGLDGLPETFEAAGGRVLGALPDHVRTRLVAAWGEALGEASAGTAGRAEQAAESPA